MWWIYFPLWCWLCAAWRSSPATGIAQLAVPLRYNCVVPVNIKRRREHGNLLRSRVIFNIRSDQIGSDPSFDRSSSLDEIWALAAMKFEERFTCEVFRNTFEIRFHHDSSGTLWYKCLCLGSTCMYYLDLHSIRKTHARPCCWRGQWWRQQSHLKSNMLFQ